jgi:two-component system response regulator HydG
LQHQWPGNCDELKAVVERALIISGADTIGPSTILFDSLEDAGRLVEGFSDFNARRGRPATLAEIEQAYIEWSLGETRGNRTAASRLLGVSYPTMKKKITDYGITLRKVPVRGVE